MTKPIAGAAWDGVSRLPAAILVDIDGTLAGPYRGGTRELRESAVPGLRLLAARAPVFLWSLAGPDNGRRLLDEFPQLRPWVQGSFGKDDFPLALVGRSHAIDDCPIDEAVCRCDSITEIDTYLGGPDSGQFLAAVQVVLAELGAE